jgi:predicted Zn-ribbon and HTH transcriptional regulator
MVHWLPPLLTIAAWFLPLLWLTRIQQKHSVRTNRRLAELETNQSKIVEVLDLTFLRPAKARVFFCKHCGHELVRSEVNPGQPVWDCPQCKAYWTWIAPPTDLLPNHDCPARHKAIAAGSWCSRCGERIPF